MWESVVNAREVVAGIKEASGRTPPGRFTAGGKSIACPHCGGGMFVKRRVVIHGPLAHCLTCTVCSLSLWFETAPERVRA